MSSSGFETLYELPAIIVVRSGRVDRGVNTHAEKLRPWEPDGPREMGKRPAIGA